MLKSKPVSLTLTTKLHRQKYDTKQKVMQTVPLDQTDNIILENISWVKNRFPDLPAVKLGISSLASIYSGIAPIGQQRKSQFPIWLPW